MPTANFLSPSQSRSSRHGNAAKDAARIQRAWMSYAAAVVLYAVVFGLWQLESVPLEVHALGVLTAALCLFPLALWGARGSRGVPIFELICIAYLLAFGLPIYTQENGLVILAQFRSFTWGQTQNALLMAAAGISCLIVGYYSARVSALAQAMPRVDLPLRPALRQRFILAGLVLGLLMFAVNALFPGAGASDDSAFASFQRVLQSQAYIALVLLAYDVFSGCSQRRALWLYLAMGAASLLGMLTGTLENVLVPLLLVFLVRWHVRKKLPASWLVLGFVLVVLLNSAKHEFRQAAWYSGEHLSASQKAGLWLGLSGQAAQATVDADEERGAPVMLRSTLSRFDLLHQFVRVVDMTPQTVPYYDGSTYQYLLYGWIPRFLWPDKPFSYSTNVLLGVDYKFLMPEQTGTTMIGIGHLPEAYANFGMWGIVIAMWLQGVLFALVDRVLNSLASDGGRAIYLTVMVFFLNGIGSSTATLFMSIAPNIVASALILRFFATGVRFKRSANAATRPASHLLADSGMSTRPGSPIGGSNQ